MAQHFSHLEKINQWLHRLGPGLLYAGAAIGVSHLVQSTRAGADFGYQLVWAIVLANLLKYPFLQFGPRFAATTGKSLLEGYASLGKWAIFTFMVITTLTTFTAIAAVTSVTAGLAMKLTGVVLPVWQWSMILLFVCFTILQFGKFSLLDNLMKFIILLLTITTIAAVSTLFFQPSIPAVHVQLFNWNNSTHLAFLIALMGWMPAPLDIAVWQSEWVLAKQISAKGSFSFKAAMQDFNLGFWATTIIALLFLFLGAKSLYGSGVELSNSAAGFANQLIDIYTNSLGEKAKWIIMIAAFTTMFSTTLTCLDALPRVMVKTINIIQDKQSQTHAQLSKQYKNWMVVSIGGVLIILAYLTSSMKQMIDFATTVAFLTAPILAYMNYKVVTGKLMTINQPPLFLKLLSLIGFAFLVGFSLLYVYSRFV